MTVSRRKLLGWIGAAPVAAAASSQAIAHGEVVESTLQPDGVVNLNAALKPVPVSLSPETAQMLAENIRQHNVLIQYFERKARLKEALLHAGSEEGVKD